VTLRHGLGAQIEGFVRAGRPVLGICNGFQALIKSGLLLGGQPQVTLTRNASARFECRWVRLEPDPQSPCVFTRDLEEPILCPAAHGEGRIAALEEAALDALEASGQVALRYAAAGGGEARYPENPNGSARGIAALCNAAGNVMGLMPHPEDHIVPEQHPRRHRGERGMMGLGLFRNGIAHAAQVAGA
jgi:phosphoribosylformylglycinamidine synthase